MKQATWILAIAMIALSGAAVAQMLSNARLVTQVPFEFVVGNHIVEPGEWVVQSATSDGMTLAIHNRAAKLNFYSNFSRGDIANASSANELVFKRYGDQYFLSEIRLEGSKIAYKLPESKAETELRAKNAPMSESILLASLK
jgi:hypothetical protein